MNECREPGMGPLPKRIEGSLTMAIEQYSNDIMLVAVQEGPWDYKVCLRAERPDNLANDVRWLLDEQCVDSHVILDVSNLESFEMLSYKYILELRTLTEDLDCRFVLCGLSSHLKWQLACVHLSDTFSMFDTREAAIRDLAGEEEFASRL
jgi:anti-anti-sigma regulatory factor